MSARRAQAATGMKPEGEIFVYTACANWQLVNGLELQMSLQVIIPAFSLSAGGWTMESVARILDDILG